MQITVGRAIAGLLFTSATGVATAFTTLYWYYLMQRVGLLLVLPVAAFIALQIFLIVRLQKSASPAVQAFGRGFGTAMMYLALFEGLIFTVLVIWVVSIAFGYDQPSSRAAYATDFILGAGYLSCFIYGATGLTTLAGGDGGGRRIAAGLYGLVTIAVPLALLIGWESGLTAWGRERPGALVLLGLAYFLAASVIGMWLLQGQMRGAGPDVEDKGRLP